MENPAAKVLVELPKSYSFPSGHTAVSFSGAMALVFGKAKKWLWIPAVVVASLIAFSRLYVYVHYPTDILAGIALGTILGFAANLIVNVAEKHVLRFGTVADEGYIYVYKEGNPFIYIVDASTINVLTYELTDYCEKMSYLRSYDKINGLTITGGGKTYDIDITGDAEKENLKAYINNKYVQYENFAELYAHIISIEFTDTGSKKADDELLVTITVDLKDGKKDVLKYYKQSDLNCFYEVNGAGRLVVSTKKVEEILEFAQNLYDGKTFTPEW